MKSRSQNPHHNLPQCNRVRFSRSVIKLPSRFYCAILHRKPSHLPIPWIRPPTYTYRHNDRVSEAQMRLCYYDIGVKLLLSDSPTREWKPTLCDVSNVTRVLLYFQSVSFLLSHIGTYTLHSSVPRAFAITGGSVTGAKNVLSHIISSLSRSCGLQYG